MHMDKLLLYYFQDSLKLLIWSNFDERDWNINDWQEFIEKNIDAKAQMAYQLIFITWESNTYYFHNIIPI